MKRLWLLFLFIVPAAAAAVNLKNIDVNKAISGAKKTAKGVAGLSDKDEAALGRDVAGYLCARYGLVRDEKVARYVSLVGQSVARRGGRDIPYYFGVLDTDEVNAYAAPGGYVFITRGLLKLLSDEAELAGALAHEVAHVAQRHAAKEIKKANLLDGGLDLASAGDARVGNLRAASDFTVGLLFKGFSRKDETAADQAAIRFAADAGYSAQGFARVLDKISAGKKDDNAFKAIGKSHPPAAQRLKSIQPLLAQALGGQENAARFAKAMASPKKKR